MIKTKKKEIILRGKHWESSYCGSSISHLLQLSLVTHEEQFNLQCQITFEQ